jgi:hypothetical protein
MRHAPLFSLSFAFCIALLLHGHWFAGQILLCFLRDPAFLLSSPTVYSYDVTLGISEFYNALIVSALGVLFLLAFSRASKLRRDNAIGVALAAFLLNVLFLTKISGFLLGLVTLLAGCLSQGRATHRLPYLGAALLAFAAITVIEFKMTGLELIPVIRDYELAAHARLAYSIADIYNGMASWTLVSSVALLVLL